MRISIGKKQIQLSCRLRPWQILYAGRFQPGEPRLPLLQRELLLQLGEHQIGSLYAPLLEGAESARRSCRQHDQIQITVCAVNQRRRQMGIFRVQLCSGEFHFYAGPVGRLILHIARQDQLLLRARHGNVQNPQLLAQRVAPDFGRDSIAAQCLHLAADPLIVIIHAQAQIRVADQAAGGVRPDGILLRQSADQADRKLEALALVNRHDPDHIRVLIQRIGLAVVHTRLCHLSDVAEEPEQSRVGGLFKIRRLNHQHPEVGTSLTAGRQRRYVGLVARLLHQPGQQLPDGQNADLAAPSQDFVQELRALAGEGRLRSRQRGIRLPFSQSRHSVIEQAVLLARSFRENPDVGNLVLRKAAEITAHHAVQRNVLAGIVQHLQELQHLADFLCGKITRSGGDIDRNAFLFQHLPEFLVPARSGAKQDDDVAVAGGTDFAGFPVFHREMPHQLADSSRSREGLLAPAAQFCDFLIVAVCSCRGVRAAAVFIRITGRRAPGSGSVPIRCLLIHLHITDQQQLGGVICCRVRILRALFQTHSVIVFHAADLAAHDSHKDVIYAVQHLGAASEILIQVDPLLLRSRRIPLLQHRVGAELIDEDLRTRQPEAIDALLDIAHHKAPVMSCRLPGNRAQNQLLNLVAVLILINHDFPEIGLTGLRRAPVCPGAVRLLFQQNLQRIALQIDKVDHILSLFFLLIGGKVFRRQIRERSDRLLHHLVLAPDLVKTQCHRPLLQLLNALLGLIPQILNPLLLVRIDGSVILLNGRNSREADADHSAQHVIIGQNLT